MFPRPRALKTYGKKQKSTVNDYSRTSLLDRKPLAIIEENSTPKALRITQLPADELKTSKAKTLAKEFTQNSDNASNAGRAANGRAVNARAVNPDTPVAAPKQPRKKNRRPFKPSVKKRSRVNVPQQDLSAFDWIDHPTLRQHDELSVIQEEDAAERSSVCNAVDAMEVAGTLEVTGTEECVELGSALQPSSDVDTHVEPGSIADSEPFTSKHSKRHSFGAHAEPEGLEFIPSMADTCVDEEAPMDISSISSEQMHLIEAHVDQLQLDKHGHGTSHLLDKSARVRTPPSNPKKSALSQQDSSDDELVTAMAELACMHWTGTPKHEATPSKAKWVRNLDKKLKRTEPDPLLSYSSESSCDQFFGVKEQ